jgi:putative nucleotidyltransferase with HDIG domain
MTEGSSVPPETSEPRWRPQLVLRTRLGRRFVLLFVLCALVPVALFGVLADRAVSAELRTQALTRVQRSAKDATVSIVQQIEQADAALVTAMRLGTDLRVVTRDDRRVQRVTFVALSELPLSSRERLGADKPLIAVSSRGDRPQLILLRADSRDPAREQVVSAELNLTNIIGGVSGLDLVPPASRLCITSGGTDFGCITAADGMADDARVQTGEARVFLRYVFGAPDLLVRISESNDAAFAPLRRFRELFIPVALCAVVLAALLAQVTIRRQTAPLAALQASTRRIADGDRSQRVPVESDDEFGDLATSFNGMTQQLDRQFTTLDLRHDVDVAILGASSRAQVIDVIVSRISDVVVCERVAMLVPSTVRDDGAQLRWVVSEAGRANTPQAVALGDSQLQEIMAAGEAGVVVRASAAHGYAPLMSAPYLAIYPINVGASLEAMLVLGLGNGDGLSADERLRVEQLVAQVAVAFSNLRLVEELRSLNSGALEALARTTDAASPWTAGHSVRVTAIAVALAEADGLDAETVDLVRRGALLHDIGKLAVPVSILDKAGPLTDEERAVMSTHPAVGARILQPIAAFAPLLPMVRNHHERWDGTGYPDRLHGEATHRLARLLAVADVAESMLAARPYRAPLTLEFVTNYIRDNAGRHFDPHFAHLFAECVRTADPRLMAAVTPVGQISVAVRAREVA